MKKIYIAAPLFAEGDREWQLKPVNYNFSHMFTFVKGRAQMLNMPQTLAVLDILRSAHGAQERRSRYGFESTYMVHPLTMACHALAMGLAEDDVIAACLVKCLDRVNNVAGMADAFSRKWMVRYTEETDRYYPAILDAVKKVPEWNNAWWLLRYQLTTMTEAFKRLL